MRAVIPWRWAPMVYGLIQAAITTGVATAISAWQMAAAQPGGLGVLLLTWLAAWASAWLTMVPVVIVVAPIIQRGVARITIKPDVHAA